MLQGHRHPAPALHRQHAGQVTKLPLGPARDGLAEGQFHVHAQHLAILAVDHRLHGVQLVGADHQQPGGEGDPRHREPRLGGVAAEVAQHDAPLVAQQARRQGALEPATAEALRRRRTHGLGRGARGLPPYRAPGAEPRRHGDHRQRQGQRPGGDAEGHLGEAEVGAVELRQGPA